DIFEFLGTSFTYDHRTLRTRLPVRSAIYKQCTGGSVVRWVTTGESPLLYVFCRPNFADVGLWGMIYTAFLTAWRLPRHASVVALRGSAHSLFENIRIPSRRTLG
ncbi:hypothetical protein CC84DRAFT_1103593, partial [Paraphaeosphaeria sporulosa]